MGGRRGGADLLPAPSISCTDPVAGTGLLGLRSLGLPRSSSSPPDMMVNVKPPGVRVLLLPSARLDPSPLPTLNNLNEGVEGYSLDEERRYVVFSFLSALPPTPSLFPRHSETIPTAVSYRTAKVSSSSGSKSSLPWGFRSGSCGAGRTFD